MHHLLRLAAVGLALALAACSLSDDEQTAADSLSRALLAKDSPKSVEDSVDCVADKWVGEVGTGPLVDDGLLTERFQARVPVIREVLAGRQPVSREVAEGYAAAWLACVDFDAMSLDLEDTHPDASDEDLDEYADCLKQIDRDLWRDAIVARWTRDDAATAPAALSREQSDCRRQLER